MARNASFHDYSLLPSRTSLISHGESAIHLRCAVGWLSRCCALWKDRVPRETRQQRKGLRRKRHGRGSINLAESPASDSCQLQRPSKKGSRSFLGGQVRNQIRSSDKMQHGWRPPIQNPCQPDPLPPLRTPVLFLKHVSELTGRDSMAVAGDIAPPARQERTDRWISSRGVSSRGTKRRHCGKYNDRCLLTTLDWLGRIVDKCD